MSEPEKNPEDKDFKENKDDKKEKILGSTEFQLVYRHTRRV